MTTSTDHVSASEQGEISTSRPFGMRYLVVGRLKRMTDAGDIRSYDPARQLTVTPSGDPWALRVDQQRMESTTDTSNDEQTTDVTDPY